MSRRSFCLCVMTLSFILTACKSDSHEPRDKTPLMENITERFAEKRFEAGLLHSGNTGRLHRFFARARAGETLTVGAIGGSITEGAAASCPEKRYAHRIFHWLKTQYPRANWHFVNAGIGATTSLYGAFRVKEHLLRHQPDLVLVDFSVNDGNHVPYGETYEGLLRQILAEPQKPAVLLFAMMWKGGVNAQDTHAPVARHYNLPYLSFRDAFWPEVEAGRIRWETLITDDVHPNDEGHGCIANMAKHYLENLPSADDEDSLPAPLHSDLFARVRWLPAEHWQPSQVEGWEQKEGNFLGPWWESATPGSEIIIEAEGTAFCLFFWRIKGDMGRLSVQVDHREPVELEGWFEADWGGYLCAEQVASKLEPGRHLLRLRLLESHNPESQGHRFCVYGLGAAGVMEK